jgi:hypothetical protein
LRTFRESKKLGLDNVFYNRVWAIPKSEMWDEIKKKNLDTYHYMNICLPSTVHVSSDDVTELFYRQTRNWREELLKKHVSKEKIQKFSKEHPFIAGILRKFL